MMTVIVRQPGIIRFAFATTQNRLFLGKFNMDYLNRFNKGTMVNLNSNCHSETKIAFLKTHRTGGSTVQNILLRFGVRHNLNFALPTQGWMFRLDRPLNATEVLEGPFGDMAPFDVFASHCRWDTEEVLKIVPMAKIITILRDPIQAFASVFALSKMKISLDDYVKKLVNAEIKVPPETLLGWNNLVWEMGSTDNNASAKIAEIDATFDLVMITEHFEESMVLLADRMCWPLEDVTHLIHNARNSEHKIKIEEDTAKLLRKTVLAGDYKLYGHLKEKFYRLVDAFGKKRMSEAVSKLNELNGKVKEECFGSKKPRLTEWHGPVYNFVLKDADKKAFWCHPHVWNETTFVRAVRQHQQSRMEELSLTRIK